jgi:hypothetical protein
VGGPVAVIEWRVNRKIKRKLDELVQVLVGTDDYSDEWHLVSDEIRSLPGCPYGTNEENDTILVVCVEEPRVGYTGPGREN